ncbi:hypothetical protein KFE96_04320 [Kordiimonas sp. SCSIO 12603]|uniref:TonB-dependent receptor plug domain-containing protein n=1 Tax=Kordiimonas sp. SCSIO 12603 TaxID=2829596 RepID=UPI002104EFB2|nr:TonB-dependent receptor [Kordiimonas sp. SCSIO 12603]UTW59537.1 hypothetical protein KFE96_04320 [Kordiimonas sp. SCSIO 12603]
MLNGSRSRELRYKSLASVICLIISGSALAQDSNVNVQINQNATVKYEPEFFQQYNPITALDLVNRVPGFTIDRGDNVRGFGGSAGNILINGKRPSTKSDSIDNILSRISQDNVLHIELIRGATGGLDLGAGQSVVVNVILKKQSSGSGTFEVTLVEREGKIESRFNVSYNDKIANTLYTVGIERFGFDIARRGVETLTNFQGPDELREEEEDGGLGEWLLNLKTETNFNSGDVFRLNFQGRTGPFDVLENSIRTPVGQSEPNLFVRTFRDEEDQFEISSDYEHKFNEAFRVKLIGLLNREYSDTFSSLNILRADDTGSFSRSVRGSNEGETIGRIEFDWTSFKNHTVQFGIEGARNFVESEFALFRDNGEGEEEINVPGANTRVSEKRGEIFTSDSWRLNSKLTLDLGFNVEFSEISQSGDVQNARTFTFAKPSAALTYVSSEKSQWRLRFEREVGQLNFNDFVSRANFQDEDLDLGNPELQPDSTWVAEATYERRFGDIGVVELTLFYNYIEDVIDLLPLGPTTESPGNIGNGERWGAEINFSTDFDFLGIPNARIDVNYRVQDSSVTDLVTGQNRRLSNERPENFELTFRKEFPTLNSNFGIEYMKEDPQDRFGVDEIESNDGRNRVNFFWETIFPIGLKGRFEVRDAFNQARGRDRTVFSGFRSLSDIAFIESRRRRDGTELFFTISGVF